ncbi:hypothetical protein [Rosenbergiella collisarenosi]|uniref:hypothetical protein n=1 Tax=Rosenbergiella collisarenosi TaxID=1544695 RepID=UPI001F4DDEA0|nr:hypothetical protein [Rosenbergiella collisarenosi]
MKRLEEVKSRLEALESSLLAQEKTLGRYATDEAISNQVTELKNFVEAEVAKLEKSDMTDDEKYHILPGLEGALAADIRNMRRGEKPSEALLNKVYDTQISVEHSLSSFKDADEGSLL